MTIFGNDDDDDAILKSGTYADTSAVISFLSDYQEGHSTLHSCVTYTLSVPTMGIGMVHPCSSTERLLSQDQLNHEFMQFVIL